MAVLTLPIFPLSVVLFPGTPQLLHIFEPRYRQMLDDCLQADRTFGLSYVAPRGDAARPTEGAVGCSAEVRGARRLPDGRSNILTVGGERYVLRRYVETDRPYLTAEVETFDDIDDETDLQELANRVRAGYERFVQSLQVLSDRPAESLELADSPRAVSFQVAAGIDVDPATKQGFLALRSTRTRLERLLRLLERLNREIAKREEVHVRARGNGKGGAQPDIVRQQ